MMIQRRYLHFTSTLLARVLVSIAMLIALAAQPALAQRDRGRPGGPPPFMKHVYPPELVMRHQHDIGVTAAQRKHITEAIQETEAEVIEIKWELQDEERKLGELLSADVIDEDTTFEQARHLMGLEQQIKLTHLRLLVRIRNQLTPAQRQQLDTLRPRGHRGGPQGF